MIKRNEKCRYCYYNTVLSCAENPDNCEDYSFNHLAKKYENKRFKAKWKDGNDVKVLVVDELEKFPDWYIECLEDAEELADFMNDLWQQIQDIEDLFCDAILTLLEKYFKEKHSQDNLVLGDMYEERINVLEELLHETGHEDLIVDFYGRMSDEVFTSLKMKISNLRRYNGDLL